MLPTTQLLQTLTYHQQVFNDPSGTNRLALLASKASILEVCGWVEQAMDLLVKECANRCGLSPQRLKDLEEIYVNPTYGFQYKKNFERMLIAVVGFPVLETVENSIPTQVTTLKVLLGDLTKLRNHYAHTHFDETSPYPQGRLSIPTPSVMIANANIAAIGLDAIELQLKAAGY